jgi:hypothetical protein
MKEYQETGDNLFRIARDLILRDGFLDPIIFVKTADALKPISVQPFLDVNSERDKQILSAIIKGFASAQNATAVYMLSEAWIYDISALKQDKSGYEMFQEMTQEQKKKVRKEVAIVTFRTASGSCSMKSARINRNNGSAWLDQDSEWFTNCESGLIPKWTE